MISKEEYARLYCNDSWVEHGIYALDQEKVFMRMRQDPMKTLQDLDDYGINNMMGPGGPIEMTKILNVRTGETTQISGRGAEEAAIRKALENRETNQHKPQATPFLDKLLREYKGN